MNEHRPHPEEHGPHRTCPAGEVERELVPPAGIEPATSTLGKSRSIRLSYGGLGEGVYLSQGEPSKPERLHPRDAEVAFVRRPRRKTGAERAGSRRLYPPVEPPARTASFRPRWRTT